MKREIASILLTFDPNTGNLNITPSGCTEAEVLALLKAALDIAGGGCLQNAKNRTSIVAPNGLIPGN